MDIEVKSPKMQKVSLAMICLIHYFRQLVECSSQVTMKRSQKYFEVGYVKDSWLMKEKYNENASGESPAS